MTITFEGRKYDIPSWSVSILTNCTTEVYNTAHVNTQTNVYAKLDYLTGLKWHWRTEAFDHLAKKHNVHEHPSNGISLLAKQLIDQKTITNDTTFDYLWYMTTYV
ncbi:hypothetical protein ACH5RR_004643 [Cinchona calisaya]|uniref:Beta-galactosidase beta-sandwich domain-containing protein n=1 Tax=Cinchona calisaya TaxID=153742 RepID=A0ABD3AY47_9GENT